MLSTHIDVIFNATLKNVKINRKQTENNCRKSENHSTPIFSLFLYFSEQPMSLIFGQIAATHTKLMSIVRLSTAAASLKKLEKDITHTCRLLILSLSKNPVWLLLAAHWIYECAMCVCVTYIAAWYVS